MTDPKALAQSLREIHAAKVRHFVTTGGVEAFSIVATDARLGDLLRAAEALEAKPLDARPVAVPADERTEFEAWYEGECLPGEADWFRRADDEPNEYAHAHIEDAWSGWQARAMLAAAPAAPAAKNPSHWPCANAFKDTLCGYSGDEFTSCGKSLSDCKARGRTACFAGFPKIGLDL